VSTGNGGDDDDGGDELDVELAEHDPRDEASVDWEEPPPEPAAAAADETNLELFREPEVGDEGDEAGTATQLIESNPPPPRATLSEAPSSQAPLMASLLSEPPLSEPPLSETPALSELPPPPLRVGARSRVIVVGGARGGVGKTVLAANLGLYLSTLGRKVVLVDADPAGANLHTCLGTAPATPLGKLRRAARTENPQKPMGLPEALRETPFRGLSLLHLGLDEPAAGSGRADRVARLLAHVRELEADYVVVDLGVGLGRELIDNYLAADVALFVTVPEPTAIENTYRFLRGAFVRYLLAHTHDEDAHAELERRIRALGGAPSPIDLLVELEQEGHPQAAAVRTAMESFRPHVVINQTRLRADHELGYAMQSAVRRRLGIVLDYVGHIDHDDTVWTCVRTRRPLLIEVPGAKSSRKIEKVVRHMLIVDAGKAPPMRLSGVPQDGHYDLLEIERGASDEEIRRAFKRCREVYSHEALCCYGLFEPHEIEKLRSRLDEAFDVLVDPARRRPYELSVFADEPEPTPDPSVSAAPPPRPVPDILPDTTFTGALLRQVRESQHLSLQEIHQRTKISAVYLRAIEDDDFGRLPELVYASGFLREVARNLRLDPVQVSRSYLGRYKRYLDDKQRAFARKQ
jgi:flagellar biosynthesis protein FlhG